MNGLPNLRCSRMPLSQTVAPYSPARTPIGIEAVGGHSQHLPPFIRDTNAIEGLNRQVRKAIKTRGHFPDEQAATKLIYLALMRAETKWVKVMRWPSALRALKIHFGDRIPY
jgi:transposase-like protein